MVMCLCLRGHDYYKLHNLYLCLVETRSKKKIKKKKSIFIKNLSYSEFVLNMR